MQDFSQRSVSGLWTTGKQHEKHERNHCGLQLVEFIMHSVRSSLNKVLICLGTTGDVCRASDPDTAWECRF